jgi:sterol desaturase/sphingolipid hydroxylase (fatty acid hydroxylase superfamily)
MLVTKQFKGSDLHHCFPTLPETIAVSVISVAPKIILVCGAFYFFMEPLELSLMVIGTIFGVLFYNLFHYYSHFGSEFSIGWMKALRNHHLNHHFKNQHILFGISSTLWDHFYKTMKPRLK